MVERRLHSAVERKEGENITNLPTVAMPRVSEESSFQRRDLDDSTMIY